MSSLDLEVLETAPERKRELISAEMALLVELEGEVKTWGIKILEEWTWIL